MRTSLNTTHFLPCPTSRVRTLLLAVALGLSAPIIHAQTAAPLTRIEVKMDRDAFLATHRWHEATDTWVLKSGVVPPMGVKPRSEVKAERDAFLAGHRWDSQGSRWIPDLTPRQPSSMSRAQMMADMKQFTRTHEWSEDTGRWELLPPARK